MYIDLDFAVSQIKNIADKDYTLYQSLSLDYPCGCTKGKPGIVIQSVKRGTKYSIPLFSYQANNLEHAFKQTKQRLEQHKCSVQVIDEPVKEVQIPVVSYGLNFLDGVIRLCRDKVWYGQVQSVQIKQCGSITDVVITFKDERFALDGSVGNVFTLSFPNAYATLNVVIESDLGRVTNQNSLFLLDEAPCTKPFILDITEQAIFKPYA